MSRGLELNNPMDLEINPNFRWSGELRPTADPDKILCQFMTARQGIRAGAKDLHNQQILHGLNNWSELITKYAPPSENNTAAYIAAMCKSTNVPPFGEINLSDPSFLALSVKAVIMQEQGENPYSDDLITQAINDALGIPVTAEV